MIPAKLRRGDEVRIVSPAVSLGFIPEGQRQIAGERLEGLGLRLSFSTNAEVMDRFDSSPVEARVADLHEAFVDLRVKAMLTTLGGYNSNGLLGGNLGTLCLLFGTPHMPDLEGSILLLEDDEEESPVTFDRHLQSLIHQPGLEGVRAVVIGKFQRASNVDSDSLKAIIESKRELAAIPIVAGASFGHTPLHVPHRRLR